MSKHSIRIGGDSRPSAPCSPSSASARRSRRRAPAAVLLERQRALRAASSRIRRFSPRRRRAARPAPRARRERIDHASRSPTLARPRAGPERTAALVVLEQELLEHLAGRALGLVGEVEGLTVGEDPVADLEDLGIGVAAGSATATASSVPTAAPAPAGARAATHGRQAVALERRLLELLGRGGGPHPRLEVALDRPKRPERKSMTPSMPHGTPPRDVADAGCRAALDVVVQARRAPHAGPAPARCRSGT